MIDALWSVRFISNNMIAGAGVVLLKQGHILGGDAQYYYVGRLTLTQDIVNAEIAVRIHTRISGFQSIFGAIDEFTLVLSGKATSNEITLGGKMKEQPNATITVICSRIAELPF